VTLIFFYYSKQIFFWF